LPLGAAIASGAGAPQRGAVAAVTGPAAEVPFGTGP
jgi:hypothetical protein